jgi:hypothetical protein
MNTFKKMILSCSLLISAASAFAQNFDQRLESYYTQEQIQDLIENDPETYHFLVNALNKAIFIAEIPQEKAPVQYNGTLFIDPNETHTFLSLGLEITDMYQYFKIEGTNKMLVVLPRIFLESKK